MSTLSEDQARAYMHKLLAAMAQQGGSDLFIAHDFAPSIKLNGKMQPLIQQKLTGELTRQLANAMMNEAQRAEFAREFECNFAIAVPGVQRFRAATCFTRSRRAVASGTRAGTSNVEVRASTPTRRAPVPAGAR